MVTPARNTCSAAYPPIRAASYTGVVGSFTDFDTNQVASAFVATVDWGDGTNAKPDITTATVTSAGMTTCQGSSQTCELFDIAGTHTYAQPGTYVLTAFFSKVGDPSIQDIPIIGAANVSTADSDLSISTPPNITVDATGPSGASVTYALPAVSDSDDTPVPVPSCSPPSGSVFPVGTTTVTCTATDTSDDPSTASSSFEVTVVGASGQVANLTQSVQNVGSGSSLSETLGSTQSLIAQGQLVAACNTLTAFTNEVAAQSGKSISTSQATTLIAEATQVQAVLAC